MLETRRIIQNRYQLEEKFLQCRFSTLYHAIDLNSGTSLVVRMLHQSLSSKDPSTRRDAKIQILREGRALSKLNHRNLPQVLEVIEEDDEIFLLLEDFSGKPMDVFIRERREHVDERVIYRWLGQLLSVVEYLHSHIPPIIHRDIHPGTIIVSPHGILKIAEFGISKIREKEETGKTLFKAVGHPAYAAPEQLLQRPSDPRNDIYSIGAVAYFVATGKPPVNSIDRMQNPQSGEKLRSLNPEISIQLEELIEKMMEPDVEKRYKNIYEVQEDWLKVLPTGISSSISLPNILKNKIATAAAPSAKAEPGIELKPEEEIRAAEEEVETAVKEKEEKKSLWDNFFSLPSWFSPERGVRAAPEVTSPSEKELEQFPFLDISTMQIDRKVGRILPEGISRSIQGVCVGKPSSKEITVAVKDPTQVYIYDHISYATQGAYRPVLVRSDPTMIDLAREFIYKTALSSTGKTWLEWLEQKKYESDKLDVKSTSDELEIFKDEIKGPVIEAVDKIIKEAISIGASDIHLETYENEMLVRYRIDGVLHPIQTYSRKTAGAIIKRLKLTAGMDIAQERITQGGRISVRVRDREFDLRVSIVPVPHGENVVMRLLNKGAFEFSLSDLGFSSDAETMYRKLLNSPFGMILVSGPTGSGKSTTLYASLSEINRPDRKLLTVEDPIEYEMPGITQVQVNLAPREDEKKVTFARALREFLRQDPDVILVGEIRDEETAAIAIQAALTGHLLLSTIHTNDSVGIITRLEDMGIEPYLVSSTLVGGLAQRLVRKVCSNCKKQVEPTPELKEEFEKLGIEDYTVFEGTGCLQCHHTGNRGRLGLYEILEITSEIRNLIARHANSDEIAEMALKQGMNTIYQDGLHKVARGLVSYEEVLRVSMQKI